MSMRFIKAGFKLGLIICKLLSFREELSFVFGFPLKRFVSLTLRGFIHIDWGLWVMVNLN